MSVSQHALSHAVERVQASVCGVQHPQRLLRMVGCLKPIAEKEAQLGNAKTLQSKGRVVLPAGKLQGRQSTKTVV